MSPIRRIPMLHREQRFQLFFWAALAFLLGPTQAATAGPIDFASGLAGWTVSGPVSAQDGVATLGDTAGGLTQLYRPAALSGPGAYTITFDLRTDLSPTVPTFGFADTLFASLYFVDDLSSFSLAPGGFDDAASLLAADHTGAIGGDATVSASSLGTDWWHVSYTFETVHAYAIPTFELFDQNFVTGDSLVQITGGHIGPAIPEPRADLVFGVGILIVVGAVTARRRREGQGGLVAR